MKSNQVYYAICDTDKKLYLTFELQEDRLRNESWYQVCTYPEISLAALYSSKDQVLLDLEQIKSIKPEYKDLKIVEVTIQIGKYIK